MYLYSLTFPNTKKYFGITNNIAQRFWKHKSGKGTQLVSRALRKYGDSVEFKVLCIGTEDYIKDLEIKIIKSYQTQDRRFGYNISPGGDVSPMTIPEVAAKVASKLKGRTISKEHKEAVSNANLGNKYALGSRSRIDHIWITDGVRNNSILKDSTIPEGWKRGQSPSIGIKRMGNRNGVGGKGGIGRFWITDGKINKSIQVGSTIPENWSKGRTRTW